MTISKPVADFAGAFSAARADLAALDTKIGQLNQQRAEIAQTPPHTDDIVAMFMRGLDATGADFKVQFAAHLSSNYLGSNTAAAVEPNRRSDILRLEASKPSLQELQDRSLTTRNPRKVELNGAVIAYFLRDRIADEIPGLVEQLCPGADKGMKAQDRQQALADIDLQLEALRADRDAIQADLDAARKAVFPGGN